MDMLFILILIYFYISGLFPVAYAVVDSETEDNWMWFLVNLHSAVVEQYRNITFISDRNNGLLEAVSRAFPLSAHSYCIHHLQGNIKKKIRGNCAGFRKKIVKDFLSCAYAVSVDVFHKNIEALKKEGGAAIADFIDSLPPENWSCAYFPGKRYGDMASSVAESFNSWILEERHLPVMNMLDKLRVKIMNFNANKLVESDTWTNELCPFFQKLLNENWNKSRHWTISRSSQNVFEVHSEVRATVDLGERTCSCKSWQIRCFPCSHAVCVVRRKGTSIYDYIEEYYKVSFYRKSYSIPIVPLPDLISLNIPIPENPSVLPPMTKRPTGRPRNKRIKSSGEITVREVTCSRCSKTGHYRSTCKEPI